MDKFWIKIMVFAAVIFGLIILVKVFSRFEPEPKPQSKTFYDVIEEDDERLRAEPEPEQAVEPKQAAKAEEAVEEVKPQFKELGEIDKVNAARLFESALRERKMGRLPGFTYKKMVDYCREIIEKYPDSVYAFKAKRMLSDIPERYRERYNITEEEINFGP